MCQLLGLIKVEVLENMLQYRVEVPVRAEMPNSNTVIRRHGGSTVVYSALHRETNRNVLI